VPTPRGQAETIVLIPLHLCGVDFIDDGYSTPLHRVIKYGPRVAMKSSLLAGLQHLQMTGHRQKCVATVNGIFIFKVITIVWIVEALVNELF
jgi:hypothetical protein